MTELSDSRGTVSFFYKAYVCQTGRMFPSELLFLCQQMTAVRTAAARLLQGGDCDEPDESESPFAKTNDIFKFVNKAVRCVC